MTFAWLSVFKWEERKGWRYLLKAFVREFGSDDTVGLYIKTSNYMGADAAAEAAALLDRLAGSEDEAVRGPAQALLKRRAERVVVDTSQWSAADMPKLFAGADAFVLPTRGEVRIGGGQWVWLVTLENRLMKSRLLWRRGGHHLIALRFHLVPGFASACVPCPSDLLSSKPFACRGGGSRRLRP